MDWFEHVFNVQKDLQQKLKGKEDVVNIVDMYNAATAAMVEIGEMLQIDTRWKAAVTGSKKEPVFDFDQFKEEWADVFIYMLNVLIYAGVDDIKPTINMKQHKNFKRFNYDKEYCCRGTE